MVLCPFPSRWATRSPPQEKISTKHHQHRCLSSLSTIIQLFLRFLLIITVSSPLQPQESHFPRAPLDQSLHGFGTCTTRKRMIFSLSSCWFSSALRTKESAKSNKRRGRAAHACRKPLSLQPRPSTPEPPPLIFRGIQKFGPNFAVFFKFTSGKTTPPPPKKAVLYFVGGSRGFFFPPPHSKPTDRVIK